MNSETTSRKKQSRTQTKMSKRRMKTRKQDKSVDADVNSGNAILDGASSQQTIEQLRLRFQQLNETKIKIQTQREHTAQRLTELRKHARDEFGTDDVEQLQKKLGEIKTANESKRHEYQQDLDRIEQQLVELDERFAEAELDGEFDDATSENVLADAESSEA